MPNLSNFFIQLPNASAKNMTLITKEKIMHFLLFLLSGTYLHNENVNIEM